MSVLVDHLGRPVSTADLGAEEQAKADGFARTHRLETIESMTPARLRGVFRAADDGDLDDLVAYTDSVIRLDGHFGAVVRSRKLALANRAWEVIAAGSDAAAVKQADLIRDLVASPQWTDLVLGCQDAVVYPLSAVEILWQTDGGQWMPRAFEHRDLRWLEIEPDDPTPVKLWAGAGSPEELRPWGWVLHRSGQFSGPPWRDGLARCLCVLRLLKTLSTRAWVELAEIFGIPLRVGKHPQNANKDQIDALRRALRAIGLDGIATMPTNSTIELLDAPTEHGNFHERLVSWIDAQASKSLVGATMTVDDGSSRAQAVVHEETKLELVRFDAIAVRKTVNRDVIRAVIDLNFGPQKRYPIAHADVDDPDELAAWAGPLAEFIDRGLPVEAAQVLDRFGFAEPAKGAVLLRPAGGGGPASFRRQRSPTRHAKEDEDAVDEHLGEVDLDKVADEWAAPVLAAAEKASTYDEFKRRLKALNVTPQTTVAELAGKMLALRGLGDATDEDP